MQTAIWLSGQYYVFSLVARIIGYSIRIDFIYKLFSLQKAIENCIFLNMYQFHSLQIYSEINFDIYNSEKSNHSILSPFLMIKSNAPNFNLPKRILRILWWLLGPYA